MLLVSFHSGENLGAYDDHGKEMTLEVLHGAPDGLLSELRGFRLVTGGLLWVASGSKSASGIVAFKGSRGCYEYQGAVASFDSVSSLWHPFDFTLDGGGNCYVSNQDTDLVARLVVDAKFLKATAAPLAPALSAGGTFLPGTFVACSDGDLPGVRATTPVSKPAGLEVAVQSHRVTNSVRGVVWVNHSLYVADEVADRIKVYDAEANYLGHSDKVKGPVHLLATGDALYVSNGTDVLSASLDSAHPEKLELQPVKGIKVPHVSGLALGAGTDLYAGSRDSKHPQVFRYKHFPADPKLDTKFPVADEPEFVLYVPDPTGG